MIFCELSAMFSKNEMDALTWRTKMKFSTVISNDVLRRFQKLDDLTGKFTVSFMIAFKCYVT